MKAFFNQLFDYNFYCNKKIIEECSRIQGIPEKSLQLFSHLLNSHHIWNCRITGMDTVYGIWQLQPQDRWAEIHYENQRNSFEITTHTADFDKRIDYENSEGRLFTNTVKDILFHIINHSTHHRAQISMDFRQQGLEPIPMDFIKYKRS